MEFSVLFLNFSNLTEDPFRITPDADYLFLTEGHATAQSYLGSSGILTDGFVVITGETGSGKSILIKDFLSQLPPNVNAVEIHQTKITPVQFLQAFLDGLGVKAFNKRKAELLSMLNKLLRKNCLEGNPTVLIVDEAQELSLPVLEEIRMLSGIETGDEPVLSIILAGQEEFREKLQLPKMKQFVQRVPLHFHLEPLDREDTREYVIHRLNILGTRFLKPDPSISFIDTAPASRDSSIFCVVCRLSLHSAATRQLLRRTPWSWHSQNSAGSTAAKRKTGNHRMLKTL